VVPPRLTFPIRMASRSAVTAPFDMRKEARTPRPEYFVQGGTVSMLRAAGECFEAARHCAGLGWAIVIYLIVKIGPTPRDLVEAKRKKRLRLRTAYAGT